MVQLLISQLPSWLRKRGAQCISLKFSEIWYQQLINDCLKTNLVSNAESDGSLILEKTCHTMLIQPSNNHAKFAARSASTKSTPAITKQTVAFCLKKYAQADGVAVDLPSTKLFSSWPHKLDVEHCRTHEPTNPNAFNSFC